jgi:hypothetical protein
MTQVEILEELRKLSPADRLSIIEAALHLIREDIQHFEQPSTRSERKRQLVEAAQALLPDYLEGGELTVFTVLDGEDVRE